MSVLDWVVIGAYFAVLLFIALRGILKSRDTTSDYFLAGHSLTWFPVGASIFASNIGSEHLVGLAGSGATDGIALAHYELHAWCLLILGWFLAPFYLKAGVYTMPEFLEKRFSPAARYLLSVISLLAYIVTKIAVGIFSGGIVFSVLFPEVSFLTLDSFWIGSLAVILVTGLYTTLGGFRVVAYTETLQTVVLLIGSALVTYFGLQAIGGWSELVHTISPEALNLWRPVVPDGVLGTWQPIERFAADGQLVEQAWYFNQDYPWAGMLFCAPIIGLWYWCTDQYIVQRVLGAKNIQEARRGSIFAAFLKLFPTFIFILPGIICGALILKSSSDYDFSLMLSEGKVIAESGYAFPLMVQNVLPAGVRGLVVAALLSALMSSLAGVFNASSTLFTMDLYAAFRPKASERQKVFIGRVATAGVVFIGVLWIPVIQGSRGLYDYLQSVQGYFAPPIFVVFFAGIFWKRLNSQGCIASLLTGFLLGLFRLLVDTPLKLDSEFVYADGGFLWIVSKIYFQYFSLLIFLVSLFTLVLVSYLTSAPDYDRISEVTYRKEVPSPDWKMGLILDRIWSWLVMVLIVAVYFYFS